MSGEPELLFRCKGCGSFDSIVEVQLVPSIQQVRPSIQQVRPDPAATHTPFGDVVDYGGVTDWREAIVVLGFACDNESCEFWQGNWGNADEERDPIWTDGDGGRNGGVLVHPGKITFLTAPSLTDIAEIVGMHDEEDDTGVNPEAGNPAFYYPVQ